jgi:hypothetical protein
MPIWITDMALVIVLLTTSELMFRFGRKQRDVERLSQVTTAQASMLGLLALFLGFSMSMADNRFDARRRIVMQEALAVGTTYLRTDFLPEPQRSHSRQLVRDYVHARIAYYHNDDHGVATARAQEIQAALWANVVAVAPTHNTELVSSYVSILNEMIDLESARAVTLKARVPWTVHFLLVLVAVIAIGVNGYATGLQRIRIPMSLVLLPALVAVACFIIVDLDRSRAGFISTGNLPMERLERSITADR